MTSRTGSGRLVGFGPFVIAGLGAFYPIVFERVAALGIGPYGGIAPLQFDRLLIAWIVALMVVAAVATLMWRLSERPFRATLLPATAVMWGLAFGWRIALQIDARLSLPGQLTIGIVVVLLVAAGWLLLKLTSNSEGAAALGVALAVPLLLIGWEARAFLDLPTAEDPVAAAAPNDDRPDVWYLVFDAMPSPAVMAELGWDPDQFVASLAQAGFIVPSDARTASSGTYVTLAQIASLAREPASGNVGLDDQGQWLATMKGSHPLAAALTGAGYDYVMVDNAWSFSRCGELVTDCRTRPMESELEWVMLVNSLAAPFASDHGPWRVHSVTQLDELEAIAAETSPRPRFIHAHMLIPHQPFELAADCSQRFGTSTEPEDAWLRTQQGFHAMMSCTADRIVRLVAQIPDDDVVLIVGDHGSDLSNAGSVYTADQLRDRMSAFVAVRGCDLASEYLTTNANAFRGIAGCVTAAEYPPWPDRPVLACVQLNGVARLTDATAALAAGDGLTCRDE